MTVILQEPDFDEVASFINPGAGLRHLDLSYNSDYIFDSIFSTEYDLTGNPENLTAPKEDSSAKRIFPIVRAYGSDHDM